jgi:sulfur-carrier protein
MPRVVFTPNLRRHLPSSPSEVSGQTVRDVLQAVFQENPKLRSYILDDQDRLREHVVVFIDGEAIQDRVDLSDAVGENTEIFVMQALSGGSSSCRN